MCVCKEDSGLRVSICVRVNVCVRECVLAAKDVASVVEQRD